MLLDFDQLVARYSIPTTGLLHIGAHEGEEAVAYERNGFRNVTWVEANPELLPSLRAHVEPFGHRVIEALVADQETDVQFNITNNPMSSSILELGTHRAEHPEVVVSKSVTLRSRTLDELCDTEGISGFGLLVMDVQGAELRVLHGAKKALEQVDYLYLEVNEAPLYVGGAMIDELDTYLADFCRIETGMTQHGWGDALYVRSSKLAEIVPGLVDRLGSALARADAEVANARTELAAVQMQRDALLASTSWRVTRPLRALGRLRRRARAT
jgi:FkbM family methyltransferase